MAHLVNDAFISWWRTCFPRATQRTNPLTGSRSPEQRQMLLSWTVPKKTDINRVTSHFLNPSNLYVSSLLFKNSLTLPWSYVRVASTTGLHKSWSSTVSLRAFSADASKDTGSKYDRHFVWYSSRWKINKARWWMQCFAATLHFHGNKLRSILLNHQEMTFSLQNSKVCNWEVKIGLLYLSSLLIVAWYFSQGN